MRVVRRSWLVLVLLTQTQAIPARAQGLAGAPVGGVISQPTKTPTPAKAATTVVLPAPTPANAGGSPVLGAGAIPHLPPFVLSEVSYFEPAMGTRFNAWAQNAWRLPIIDTMPAAGVTFLFDVNVPKTDIEPIVEKKLCCFELHVAGQPVPATIAFAGEKLFVRGTVPNMQSWPKAVQLRLYHSGGAVSPADVNRASASGGANAPSGVGAAAAPIAARGATSAPYLGPSLDYKSIPVTVQGKPVSYFATVLYSTFSNARCTDCHSMGDPAAVSAQHAANGVPNVASANAHQAGCGGTSCHSLVKDWRTPPFSLGINWKGKSAKEICGIVTSHLPSGQALHTHFHDDPRVVWAVSSGWIPPNGQGKGVTFIPTAPPHNANAWFQYVDTWINGGFPCPQ